MIVRHSPQSPAHSSAIRLAVDGVVVVVGDVVAVEEQQGVADVSR